MTPRLRPLLATIAVAAMTATAIGGAQVTASAQTLERSQRVIVLLKDQPAAAKPGTAAGDARSRRIAAAQAPVIRRVADGLKGLKAYRTIDAFAATLPAAAVSDLRADDAVAAVVADSTIRIARPVEPKHGGGLRLNDVPGACSTVPQREEASVAVKAVSDDPKAQTARSLGYTGKGVTVAWLADGIDTKNVNLLRDPADPSSSVFSDYQDFSGDGPDAPTTAAEAFIDANAIAGQGKHVYDVQDFSATPTSGPCRIRIEGTAPGVDLVGLKIFADSGLASTSGILQAIDYAVQTDHVDVINESFGGDPFPDVTTADVVKQFNDMAVDAGVTVTVSSGDSGPFNGNGSPSTDPKVVAVGASTTFRAYAQTNYAGARYFAPNGWENGNISALSSSGISEDGGVLDVVAPGDSSWASCTADARYEECSNYRDEPSDVIDSGGTSESAPVTAGVAALVIQAYERAHGGARPAPELVKRILTSTATDLQAPAEEQGAGLVNALQAVRLAASVEAAPDGDTLLTSTTALVAAGRPGTPQLFRVGLTNTGARAQRIRLSGRTTGDDRNVQTGSVVLSDATSPEITDWLGRATNYQKVVFTVPAGQDRLTAEYAYSAPDATDLAGRVRVDLVDPDGRLAAHSLPQGTGDHGFSDVLTPEAGRWTAYVFSPTSAFGGTQGRVPYRIATQRSQPFGAVSDRSVVLAPGRSTTVTVAVRTPADPGDQAGALVIASDLAGTTTVPIALRSRVDVGSDGRFAGVVTGGNGRDPGAQQEYFTFRVPAGVTDLSADLKLQTEADDQLGLYLVGPGGDVGGYGENLVGDRRTKAATATTLRPAAGIWTLIVVVQSPTDGEVLRVPFTGAVRFDTANVSARGLPNDQRVRLTAGSPVTIPVRVRNTGAATESVFIDARTRIVGPLALDGLAPTTGVPVPSDGATLPLWFVPSETSTVAVTGTGTVPIQFDTEPGAGDPDVESRNPTGGFGCATTETAAYSARDRAVASGVWYALPSECGPYAAPARPGTVDFTATATTRGFDTAVTSPTGDAELTAVDASTEVEPVVIRPGETATIPVTIAPKGASGTRVTGDLFIDAVLDDVAPYGQVSANELASLPYDYTIR